MSKTPDYLYHLTDQNSVAKILISGLVPKIGENSKLCQEQHAYIYLCDRISVPYWQIILNKPCVIRIPYHVISDTKRYDYGNYCEFLTQESIPAEYITEILMPVFDRANIMHQLNLSYLKSISYTCVSLARYYHYQDKDMTDYLRRNLNILTHTLNNLDYSVSNETALIDYLTAYGDDGEYAFTDTHMNTPTKLWEQLILYPKDELSELRKKLHNYIQQNFSDHLLSINTGGWTG